MRPFTSLLAICLFLLLGGEAQATVLSGPLVVAESAGQAYVWGDGVHDLLQRWSLRTSLGTGWFYGSTYIGESNADVYVARGMTDPTTVEDASVFSYSDAVDWAGEGDTVFFRGTNGYYGAWRVDDIYHDAVTYYLDGQWYFVDDGSADFTGPQAVEGKTWTAVKMLYR
jgi:hypothetical protein